MRGKSKNRWQLIIIALEVASHVYVGNERSSIINLCSSTRRISRTREKWNEITFVVMLHPVPYPKYRWEMKAGLCGCSVSPCHIPCRREKWKVSLLNSAGAHYSSYPTYVWEIKSRLGISGKFHDSISLQVGNQRRNRYLRFDAHHRMMNNIPIFREIKMHRCHPWHRYFLFCLTPAREIKAEIDSSLSYHVILHLAHNGQ